MNRYRPAAKTHYALPITGALFVLALTLGACSEPSSDISVDLAPAGSPPPYPRGCAAMTDVPEHIYAANQMIADSTDDLIFDRTLRNTLAGEIRDVLSVLRLHQPWTEEIPVHLEYGPGLVGVGLEAKLMERVREATAGERMVGPVATGIPELDGLNARLGLRGFWLVSSAEGRDGSISLCLNDRVNVHRAAEEYARIDGVRHAETSGIVSIPGPLPKIRLKKGDSGWYVIASRPQNSFSIFADDVHYFRVSGAVVHEVDPDDAAGMLIFEDLARSSRP